MKTQIASTYHQPNGDRLEFWCDFATGELGGKSASVVESLLSDHDGRAHFAWQQSFPAPDPLHNPKSMAMVLRSWGYHDIEGELGDLRKYPWPKPDRTPKGAVN